jgi:CHAT domain-containing protein
MIRFIAILVFFLISIPNYAQTLEKALSYLQAGEDNLLLRNDIFAKNYFYASHQEFEQVRRKGLSHEIKKNYYDKLEKHLDTLLLSNRIGISAFGVIYKGCQPILDDILDFHVSQWELDAKEEHLTSIFKIMEQQIAFGLEQYLGTRYINQEDRIQAKKLQQNIDINEGNVEEELSKKYPDYAKITNLQQNISKHKRTLNKIKAQKRTFQTIRNVQKTINRHTSYIQFYNTSEYYYALQINKNTSSVFRLGAKVTVDSLTMLLLEAQRSSYDLFTEASNQLYDLLLQGALSKIQVNRLILLPKGKLNQLPFSALISQRPLYNDQNWSKLSYLVKDYAISYEISAGIFMENNKNSMSKPVEILFIAPDFNQKEKEHFFRITKDSAYLSMASLSSSKSIAHNLSHLFEIKLLTKNNATIQRFTEVANDYAIVHFHTHSQASFKSMKENLILFSPYDKDTISQSGIMRLDEMMNLSIKPELVVLGGCETAVGRVKLGDEVLSLAYGFRTLGTPSLVNTMWKIEERSTKEILISFYKFLEEGFPKDKALQKAKIDFINNNSSWKKSRNCQPYYWAGITMNGNVTPVEFKKKSNLLSFLLPFSIIFLTFLYVTFKLYRLKITKR